MASAKSNNLISIFCFLALLGQLQSVSGAVIVPTSPGALVSEEQTFSPKLEGPPDSDQESAAPHVFRRALRRYQNGRDAYNQARLAVIDRTREINRQREFEQQQEFQNRNKGSMVNRGRIIKGPYKFPNPRAEEQNAPKKDKSKPLAKYDYFLETVQTVADLAATILVPNTVEVLEAKKCTDSEPSKEYALRVSLRQGPLPEDREAVQDVGMIGYSRRWTRSKAWDSRTIHSKDGYVIDYTFAPNGRFSFMWRYCLKVGMVRRNFSKSVRGGDAELFVPECTEVQEKPIGSLVYQFSRLPVTVRRRMISRNVCQAYVFGYDMPENAFVSDYTEKNAQAQFTKPVMESIWNKVDAAFEKGPVSTFNALYYGMRDDYYLSHPTWKFSSGWGPHTGQWTYETGI